VRKLSSWLSELWWFLLMCMFVPEIIHRGEPEVFLYL
jgi:hypothetical protein